jgi:alpha-amylase/alpha-mannosidase (GH57 family)
VLQAGKLSQAEQAQVETQLAVCEGSDWFWWLGDVNAAQSVTSFDALYRRNLSNLYHLLKLPIPKALSQPISIGSKTEFSENAGTMKRGST